MDFLENLDESQIKESKHFIESNMGRYDDVGLIYHLLFNQKPVQVGKTKFGTYKLVYEHPNQKSKDIYLIIMIIKRQEILINHPFSTVTKNIIDVPEMNVICSC